MMRRLTSFPVSSMAFSSITGTSLCGLTTLSCELPAISPACGLRNAGPCITPNPLLSFIRRSRGYAPDPITLPDEGPEVLGCGADLKNTFTVTKGAFAIPSQHIGDMENYETLKFFEECLENIRQVFRVNPVAMAHDLHPGYFSTQWALRQGVQTYGIQHHYAHIG